VKICKLTKNNLCTSTYSSEKKNQLLEKKGEGINKNLYLIFIKRTQILIVLNKFIFAPELIRIKEMKQGPTKQGVRMG